MTPPPFERAPRCICSRDGVRVGERSPIRDVSRKGESGPVLPEMFAPAGAVVLKSAPPAPAQPLMYVYIYIFKGK